MRRMTKKGRNDLVITRPKSEHQKLTVEGKWIWVDEETDRILKYHTKNASERAVYIRHAVLLMRELMESDTPYRLAMVSDRWTGSNIVDFDCPSDAEDLRSAARGFVEFVEDGFHPDNYPGLRKGS